MSCILLLLIAAADAAAQNSGVYRLAAEAGSSDPGPLSLTSLGFAREQLRHNRVRAAQEAAAPRIARMYSERGIAEPSVEMFVRVFKRDRLLEVWVRPADRLEFELLTTYGICALAGKPGPKRREGDDQVPEGFYHIDLFNPHSEYYLSLRIDYPNARDRAANTRGLPLGGGIFIHGGCRSAGCLAVTDEGIEDLYWLAVEARAAGQRRIPVHIFPARLEDAEMIRMADIFLDQPHLMDFWRTLKPGYDYFEDTRRLPRVEETDGVYRLARGDD